MKGVLQRRLTADGDCLTACIATILEYDYDLVPDFGLRKDENDWWLGIQQWLGLRGFQMLRIELNAATKWFAMTQEPLCICVGPNPNGWAHATVGIPKPTTEGDQLEVLQIWDPAGGKGVEAISDLIFLVPLDPSKQLKIKRQIFFDDEKAKHNGSRLGASPDAGAESTGAN